MTKATIDQNHQTISAREMESIWVEVEKQNNRLSELRRYLAVGKWVFFVTAIPVVIFLGPILFGEQPPFGISGALNHAEIRTFQFSAFLSVAVGLLFCLVIGFLFVFDTIKIVYEDRFTALNWLATLTDRVSKLESQHTNKEEI